MLSRDEYKIKRKELMDEIQSLRETHYKQMYEKINALYQLELSHDPTFTIRKLSLNLIMSEQTLYKMLAYNDAPIEIKKMVDNNKISFAKATRILAFIVKRDK